jgi:hypothetical protein
VSEELSQGDRVERSGPDAPRPRRPSGRRSLPLVGALVVAGIVGWQVLSIVTRPPAPAPPQRLPPVPARDQLVVDRVCTWYSGTGPVEVSFRLTNHTQRTVQLLTVEPQLPLGMLKPESARFEAGRCSPSAEATTSSSDASGAPLPAPSLSLGPGDWVPVTFYLRPLVQCPQPAPVGAHVAAIEEGVRIDHELAVLNDLGSIEVAGCS